jgi:hypothetical protein
MVVAHTLRPMKNIGYMPTGNRDASGMGLSPLPFASQSTNVGNPRGNIFTVANGC